MRKEQGFSLVQIMIALAIMGILGAIALPSFQTQIADNKTETKSKEVVNGIKLARSEAMKRGIPVSICPSNADGTQCDNILTFGPNGWIVFTDDIADGSGNFGQIENGESIILYRKGDDSVTISLSRAYIRFNADGSVSDE